MTKIIITGSQGRIGRALLAAAPQFPQLDIVGKIGRGDDLNTVISRCDVVIDFSFHRATLDFAKICARNRKAMVIGTTGHTDTEKAQIQNLKSQIPIVWSSNYSIGVNALFGLVRKMAKMLGPEFDVEILEMHHKHKKDAPSGTAKTFFKILKEVREEQLERNVIAKQGRPEGIGGERDQAEIGIHSMRGGDVICDHAVIFAAPGDVVELKQRATSRETFARGALQAALWVVRQNPGLYDMQDVLGLNESLSQHDGEHSYAASPAHALVTH
jgi:4-hydroxy-tetrahydrodipicolinate reductase